MSVKSSLQNMGTAIAKGCRRALEPVLYSGAMHCYAGVVKLAALRNRKAALMTRGHRDTWRKLRDIVTRWDAPVLWVHAASLGEFEQGRPLMEYVRRAHPETKILLSFFSPSGFEVRKEWPGADAVVYLPFDTPRNARRFVEMVRPTMSIFVKYEFWRNYLLSLHYRNVPTYLISAVFRPEQTFFRASGAWYRDWLRLYRHIFVQDERSRKLLASIDIGRVTVAGDTRFDRVSDIMRTRHTIAALEAFRNASTEPVLIAGSSWPADEKVYLPWVLGHNVRTVIAPHEFDNRRLEKLLQDFPDAVLLSQCESEPEKAALARTLIIDCFGLLSSAYPYGDIAYVGGGFGAGLHNINEAAVYSMPVIYGPNNGKFIEAREMAEAGGGFPVTDAETFAAAATLLLEKTRRDEAGLQAGAYIRSKLGATGRICSEIFPD